MRSSAKKMLLLLGALALVVSACGGDDEGGDTTAAPVGDEPVANACPDSGCSITIAGVEKSGDELKLTWDANFLPDVSKNHIHVYWDTFQAEEVSSDAEANGFTQGDWSPTGDYPEYVTESGASVANRGSSTTLCVTAADRDHAILDATLVQCRDVADEL
ncbi:MAG: hypothetical protein HKN91_12480 [Acidimicrobiia bacterium]|nr:hypothetical protein [Acidimicrobiia bacterium]